MSRDANQNSSGGNSLTSGTSTCYFLILSFLYSLYNKNNLHAKKEEQDRKKKNTFLINCLHNKLSSYQNDALHEVLSVVLSARQHETTGGWLQKWWPPKHAAYKKIVLTRSKTSW